MAFTLFTLLILAAGSGATTATRAASDAQQRSAAFALVSADIGNVTALPFADLTNGLNPSADSLSADPNVQYVSSNSTYLLKMTGKTLATSNTNGAESPLVPHISTTTTAGIAYKVSTYPSVSSAGLVDVVVVVTWTSALARQTAQVVGEAQVAAP